ncbi:ADP-heptose:LPS heptosyltransferase [Streptosporangium becharense]|uniref:ADP-heptose:LPS heptosyltransferase n=1 Tax=Streptosporangium becharense TaxID=1816182 RepID=A0A7W9MF30_9ACTN|nr:glycosyltransferase family 9 protein [Streptosporangium becharense]MBB2912045.1 ADP-heptose:LPS heptosyltransferase [Streptosporangium becharense]MBB5818592.1 ADP-heptose:LPS heptosyltransferase [Streptosporangium becharense]
MTGPAGDGAAGDGTAGAGTVLVARPDNAGDVLLAGPAIRAVAAGAREVVLLAGPHGRAAGELLPGVSRVVEWRTPWIDPAPPPMTGSHVLRLLRIVREAAPEQALILTSFHQSPLPLALLLRLAGVPRIAAISADYPGSLLDVRHVVDEDADVPEAERMLGLARAAGFDLPPGDAGGLAVRHPLPEVGHLTGPAGYVVVHPGVSAPARSWPAESWTRVVHDLVRAGRRVVVTGGPGERALTARVAGGAGLYGLSPGPAFPGGWPAGGPARLPGWPGVHPGGPAPDGGPAGTGTAVAPGHTPQEAGRELAEVLGDATGPAGRSVVDLGGRTDLAELAAVLAGAAAVVVANTGPAHLAAAVGTPVVSLFAPVVPAGRWAPYGVPVALLGDQQAPCRGSRARVCPVPGHPCLSSVPSTQVVEAVNRLTCVKEAVT